MSARLDDALPLGTQPSHGERGGRRGRAEREAERAAERAAERDALRADRAARRAAARRAWVRALPAAMLSLVTIAAMGWVAFFALREGLADSLAIQANQRIMVWEAGGALSGPQMQAIETSIRRAIELSPANGDHQETLGTLYFARAVAPGRTLNGRLRDFDRAVVHYREATRRSRASGYAWGNLLIAKHYAGQVDMEFFVALRKASRLAPLEAPVQAIVLGVVLPRWNELGPEARRIAADTVVRGWDVHRDVLVAEARMATGHSAWCARDPGLPMAEQVSAMRRLCEAVSPSPFAVSAPAPGPRRGR